MFCLNTLSTCKIRSNIINNQKSSALLVATINDTLRSPFAHQTDLPINGMIIRCICTNYIRMHGCGRTVYARHGTAAMECGGDPERIYTRAARSSGRAAALYAQRLADVRVTNCMHQKSRARGRAFWGLEVLWIWRSLQVKSFGDVATRFKECCIFNILLNLILFGFNIIWNL